MNIYGYVGNDPLNQTDPTGLAGNCVTIDAAGGYKCDYLGLNSQDDKKDDPNKNKVPPQRLDNSKAEKLAKEKTKGGGLSRSDANQIRSVNLDRRLNVRVAAPTVVVNKTTLDKKGYASGIAVTDWSTHGNVSVEGSSGKSTIKTESYDFEPHENQFFRNLETDIGRWNAGPGIDFNIEFEGAPSLIDSPF